MGGVSMEWKEVDICQLCDSVSETYKGNASEVVLINTSDVLDGKCLNHEYVPNKKLKGQFKKTFRKGDILYSEIRPANKRFCFVDFEPKDYIASTKLMVLRAHEDVDPQYLYQILRSNDTLAQLQMLAESRSGTFPQITYSELSNIMVSLPSQKAQKNIVSILSSLDRKIELNNKINADLEEMAQAIFKNWFVDFEPFKDGKFVDSELGMIPEGWKVGCLGDMGAVVCGKTPSKSNSNYYEGDIPFIKIPDMHGNVFVENSEDRLTEEGSLSQIKKLIPPYSLMVSCIATVGLVSINTKPSHTNQQINTVIPHNKSALFYLYQHIKNNEEFLKNMGRGGTTTLNVNTKSFSNIRLLIPSEIALDQFHGIVEGLFKKIELNMHESRTLSLLRDTLLPRLMSGELEVPE